MAWQTLTPLATASVRPVGPAHRSPATAATCPRPHQSRLPQQLVKPQTAALSTKQLRRGPPGALSGRSRAPRGLEVSAMALPDPAAAAAICGASVCLGFWKSEYGVSYAYGGSLAVIGAAALATAPGLGSTLAEAHALLLLLYGARLCAFLLFRELTIKRFREFKEKIEERAKARGSRLSRWPFLLMCAVLYAGLAAPLYLTAGPKVASYSPPPAAVASLTLAYVGWAVAALGDLQKTWAKASRGSDTLVTGGLYSVLRHPNYTGEFLMWSGSAATGVICAAAGAPRVLCGAVLGPLALSLVGLAGILFVLMQATRGLEQRHAENYGGSAAPWQRAEYEAWVGASWGGPSLPPRAAAPAETAPRPAYLRSLSRMTRRARVEEAQKWIDNFRANTSN